MTSPPRVPAADGLIPIDLDGNALLTEVHRWFGRYIRVVHDDDLILMTLWAAHTHLVREVYMTPRMQFDSPMPESGKTTALEHLQRLCADAVLMASVPSPALIARMLHERPRTLLIDEADRTLNPKNDGVGELLAVLNSGYKRGATRPVLVPAKGGKWQSDEMSTFAPVAIAGNQPSIPDDTRSRILRVLLLPDMDGNAEESDWEMIEPDARKLHDRLAEWADSIRDHVRTGPRPPMPSGIVGRFREKWQPLKRVAVHADGDWASAVDRMAIADRAQWEADKQDGLVRERPALILLRHLVSVWPGGDFVATKDLLDALHIAYPKIWGDQQPDGRRSLTAQGLGKMLAGNYKINSDRETRDGPRGYRRYAVESVLHRLHRHPSTETGAGGATGATGANAPEEPEEPDAPVTGDRSEVNSRRPVCTGCGRPLMHPVSIRRGICTACASKGAL